MFVLPASGLNEKRKTKLFIGCIKNPVGKATNGRHMKKENWTGQDILLETKCNHWPCQVYYQVGDTRYLARGSILISRLLSSW